MTDNSKNQRKFREKLQDHYRLVVLNDKDLSEVKSYRLSALNIYVLISSFILIISILLASIIVFTPIKRLIPGFGDVSSNHEFVKLKKKVDVLEKELDAQNTYVNGMKSMLFEGITPTLEVSNPEIIEIENSIKEKDKPKIIPNLIEHLYFMAPIKGDVSANFLNKKNHFGVDIIAPKGSAISAIGNGVIVFAEWNLDTGNTITVQHDNDVLSIYKHCDRLLKKSGNKVKEGESIAIIGNTGLFSSGPHLHFELWFDGKPVDPENYISFSK